MVEEIMNYKAPIMILPKRAVLQGQLVTVERRIKRSKKAETIKALQYEAEMLRNQISLL